jgi:hypothetical protein
MECTELPVLHYVEWHTATTTACTVCPALMPLIVGNQDQVIASVVELKSNVMEIISSYQGV